MRLVCSLARLIGTMTLSSGQELTRLETGITGGRSRFQEYSGMKVGSMDGSERQSSRLPGVWFVCAWSWKGLIWRERFQGHIECEMPVKCVELKYFSRKGK